MKKSCWKNSKNYTKFEPTKKKKKKNHQFLKHEQSLELQEELHNAMQNVRVTKLPAGQAEGAEYLQNWSKRRMKVPGPRRSQRQVREQICDRKG
jgi:hypothetical protein